MPKLNYKKIAVFCSVAAVFVSLSAIGLQKNTANGQEDKDSNITCDKQIPMGEALDGAMELTGNIRNTVFSAEQSAEEEIAAAQSLISAVQSCNPDKCNPVCRLVPQTCYSPGGPNQGPIPYSCPVCEHDYCTGEICPENSINSAYGKVEAAYNKIFSAQKTGQSLIEDKSGAIPQTQAEKVQVKLNQSRGALDGCFLTDDEWTQYIEGEKVGKQLVSCEESFSYSKNLSEECAKSCDSDINSSKCFDCLGCKSPGNFFCCDIK